MQRFTDLSLTVKGKTYMPIDFSTYVHSNRTYHVHLYQLDDCKAIVFLEQGSDFAYASITNVAGNTIKSYMESNHLIEDGWIDVYANDINEIESSIEDKLNDCDRFESISKENPGMAECFNFFGMKFRT